MLLLCVFRNCLVIELSLLPALPGSLRLLEGTGHFSLPNLVLLTGKTHRNYKSLDLGYVWGGFLVKNCFPLEEIHMA